MLSPMNVVTGNFTHNHVNPRLLSNKNKETKQIPTKVSNPNQEFKSDHNKKT